VYKVVGDAHALFGELLEARPSVSTDIEDVISDTLNEINNKTSKLVKTEYPGLDQFAGGLTKGEITIIGGRPGHGKTTFLVNLSGIKSPNHLKGETPPGTFFNP